MLNYGLLVSTGSGIADAVQAVGCGHRQADDSTVTRTPASQRMAGLVNQDTAIETLRKRLSKRS